MHGRRLLLALLLAFPLPIAAQTSTRATPIVGVSAGTTRLAERLVDRCDVDVRTYPTVAAHAGVARGAWSVALHGSLFAWFSGLDCLAIPSLVPDGAYRARYYSDRVGTGDAALALQLRYAPVSSFWSAGVGAGRLFAANAPYGLAHAGVHSRGRVRVGAEVEQWFVRLGYEDVEREWANQQLVRSTSLGSGQEWYPALALRLGVEVR